MKAKAFAVLLGCTALVMPTAAAADPITALFSLLFTSSLGTLTIAGIAVSGTLGTIILNVGFSLLSAWLQRSNAPSIETARVNTRLVDAPRWQMAGTAAVGGALGTFAEYDAAGNFWYIVAHGDAEMGEIETYILDGIEVSLAPFGIVQFDVTYAIVANVPLSGEVVVGFSGPDEVFSDNSRVLVMAQTDPIQNGIYVTAAGAWSRASDMAAGSDIGDFVVTAAAGASAGAYNALYQTGVIGTDPLVWSVNGFVGGDVLTEDFCLTDGWRQYEGSGQQIPIFRVYPVTPTADQVYGDRPAEFAAAFPDLPADFYLAGVAYTIVRCRAIPIEHYQNGYRWRGQMGLGEPGVTVVANWNRMYDPRNEDHEIDDPETWTASDGNPEIIWAWWRTHRYGRNKPMTSINWALVAAEADKCDATVLDRSAQPIPRYRGGFAFPDNKPRHECEREILDTCDGFVVYDDDGKAWMRVGVYEAPTLTFSGARDILSEQTQTVDDGEAQIDGVIVEYISPDHGYTKQPCAPWKNPNFFDEAITPNYRTIQILGCQNHNQAVRMAKAYGLGFGPLRKAALGTTIKGVLAKGERTITLDLDDEFQGAYQIATPVIEGANGREATFSVVPMQTDRYDLNEGEEGPPPAIPEPLDIDDSLEVAQNVVLTAAPVQTASGDAVRLEATFDAPVRLDRDFRFRYARTGDTIYEYFTTDMDELRAYSAIVEAGAVYDVSWQTVTGGGRATEWSDPPQEITATVAPIDIDDLVDPGGDGISRSVAGLPDGTQLVVGDGEWWRRVSDNTIVTAARYVALFDLGEYQVERVPGAIGDVLGLTRASAGTYIDADGVLQSAATDVPRIDHALGTSALLVEAAATNLVEQSRDLSAGYWSKTQVTISTATGPGGASQSILILPTAVNASHYILPGSASYSSGQTYVTSGLFRANGYDFLRLGFPSGAFAASERLATFNLATGTVDGVQAGVSAYITQAGDWWLCEVVATAIASTSGYASAVAVNDAASGTAALLTFTGDGVSGIIASDLQTELGARATSRIETAGSTETRAADVPVMQGVTATLDLAVRYGDGTTASLAGQSVSPSYWPSLSQTRVRRIVARNP